MFGALLLAMLSNLMNLIGISPFDQQIVKGVVIILAVLFAMHATRKRIADRRTTFPTPQKVSLSRRPSRPSTHHPLHRTEDIEMNIEHTRLRGRAGLLAVGAVIAFSIAGCSSGAASTPQSTSIASDTPKPSIYCGEECTAQLELEAAPDSREVQRRSVLERHVVPVRRDLDSKQIPDLAAKWFPDMKVTVTDGQNDATTQSGQVDEMVAQGIDVLDHLAA